MQNPFAKGSSRQVFYSKKYNVVIKKPYEDGYNYRTANSQTEKEQEIFSALTAEEKQFFPIIDFIEHPETKDLFVIMHKVDYILADKEINVPRSCLECAPRSVQMKWISTVKKQLGLKFNATKFVNCIRRHKLTDLHHFNLGVFENRLVIIDFGWY